MYVCIHICVYVYVHARARAHTHTHTHRHSRMHTHIWMNVCVGMCMCLYMHFVFACVSLSLYLYESLSFCVHGTERRALIRSDTLRYAQIRSDTGVAHLACPQLTFRLTFPCPPVTTCLRPLPLPLYIAPFPPLFPSPFSPSRCAFLAESGARQAKEAPKGVLERFKVRD